MFGLSYATGLLAVVFATGVIMDSGGTAIPRETCFACIQRSSCPGGHNDQMGVIGHSDWHGDFHGSCENGTCSEWYDYGGHKNYGGNTLQGVGKAVDDGDFDALSAALDRNPDLLLNSSRSALVVLEGSDVVGFWPLSSALFERLVSVYDDRLTSL